MLLLLGAITSSMAISGSYSFTGDDINGRPCQGVSKGFGPFDYSLRHTLPAQQLTVVEKHHFTPNIESLVSGNSGPVFDELAYTLRAWPNHHRALNSISRYTLISRKKRRAVPIPAECWMQRAISFSPEDSTVYMLYGAYLQKAGKPVLAERNYKKALNISPQYTQAHYNYGLLLVAQKRFKLAKKHALEAYNKSFPFSGLKNKLKKAGHWP